MKIAMKISPEYRLNLAEVYSCRSSVLNLLWVTAVIVCVYTQLSHSVYGCTHSCLYSCRYYCSTPSTGSDSETVSIYTCFSHNKLEYILIYILFII